jgi:hypothetical protein
MLRPQQSDWRARAERAEAALATLQATAIEVGQELAGIQLRMADQAVLISIVRVKANRYRLNFVRNGVLTTIETYVTMDFDIEATERALLHRQG